MTASFTTDLGEGSARRLAQGLPLEAIRAARTGVGLEAALSETLAAGSPLPLAWLADAARRVSRGAEVALAVASPLGPGRRRLVHPGEVAPAPGLDGRCEVLFSDPGDAVACADLLASSGARAALRLRGDAAVQAGLALLARRIGIAALLPFESRGSLAPLLRGLAALREGGERLLIEVELERRPLRPAAGEAPSGFDWLRAVAAARLCAGAAPRLRVVPQRVGEKLAQLALEHGADAWEELLEGDASAEERARALARGREQIETSGRTVALEEDGA